MNRLTDPILSTDPVASTDRSVLAIIQGTARSLMVDGGNSPRHAEGFLAELAAAGLPAPDYIAVTHAHCDHIFGLSRLGGIVLANSLTRDRISNMAGLSWNDPEVAPRVASGEEHEMTGLMLRAEMPGDRSDFAIRPPDVVYERRLTVDLGGVTCTSTRMKNSP